MKIYTTGQVSKLCQVATSTVNKWVDSGKLKAFRVPGSRHRRIAQKDLIRFLKANNFPLDQIKYDDVANILVVSDQGTLIDVLRRGLVPNKSFRIVSARNIFEAGFEAERLRPDCAVIDFSIGEKQAQLIAERVSGRTSLESMIKIAIVEQRDAVATDSFDEVFVKPFDVDLLGKRIRTLLSVKTGIA